MNRVVRLAVLYDNIGIEAISRANESRVSNIASLISHVCLRRAKSVEWCADICASIGESSIGRHFQA